jgi:Na+/H+ antiporter NhaD/arsenite permease-like protein
MITMVGQRITILMGVIRKHKIYKKNDWKKYLLAVNMIIIKHILEWEKFMR